MTKIRTRFAPSPTGYLHIGGLRSALYAYLFAKKNGGDFILRIEDTDQERFVEGATELIYTTLQQTGLHWDEGPDVGGAYGPYVQTDRRDIYVKYAKELVARGGGYYCFCTKDELDTRRAAVEAAGDTFKYDKHCLHLTKEQIAQKLQSGCPHVIRQNIPITGTTTFSDLIFGDITVNNSELDDNVLLKADGLPTYNFANVVDDHLMEITHVMRGTEYLSSTPKYNLVYEGFGWQIPYYIHMSPVMKDASHKLSKRHGDASYEDFIKKGYLMEAIVNYIALLGWNPGTNQEKFTLQELEQAFGIEGMSKSPAIFDNAKLMWLNGEYVRALSPEAFRRHALPWYELGGLGNLSEEKYEVLDRILQPRVEIFSQIPEMVGFFTQIDPTIDPQLYVNKKSKTTVALSKQLMSEMLPLLESCDWSQAALHALMTGYAVQTERKNGTVMWPVRIAMSAKTVTPGGAVEIAVILGKEESLRRIKAALAQL